jgi:hypothetical protein
MNSGDLTPGLLAFRAFFPAFFGCAFFFEVLFRVGMLGAPVDRTDSYFVDVPIRNVIGPENVSNGVSAAIAPAPGRPANYNRTSALTSVTGVRYVCNVIDVLVT